MNIFLFDPLNLESQAQAHPDKLVVKMQLEASQLLANALSSLYNISLPKKDSTPFKLTHTGHPCSKWMCFDKVNAAYGLKYLESLACEYERRYLKRSSTYRDIITYVQTYTDLADIHELPRSFAIAIPDKWIQELYQDSVISLLEYNVLMRDKKANPTLAKALYANYLLRAKTSYAEWKFSKPPEFWSVGAELSKSHGRFCRRVFKV